MKMVDMKVQPPKVEAVDPLVHVANIPEKLLTEASDEGVSSNSNLGAKYPEDVSSTAATGSMFPWAQQAKLLEMAETNTRFIWRFADLFTRARSPQDLLALSADFSKEATVLFEQQSSAMLKIFVGQPTA